MNESLNEATKRLREPGQALPVLLTAAYVGLELATSAVRALSDTCAEQELDAVLMALTEAAEARDALGTAPSLIHPEQAFRPQPIDEHALASSLATLAMTLCQVLVIAAERSTDPADKAACLNAILHAGRLHEALR